jgi:hypothetical protein
LDFTSHIYPADSILQLVHLVVLHGYSDWKPLKWLDLEFANSIWLAHSRNSRPRLFTEDTRIISVSILPPESTRLTNLSPCQSHPSSRRDTDKRVGGRDRRGETLFIDARKLGQLETRVNRVFDDDDIAKIANAYHAWRQDGETSEDYGEASVTCLDLLAMKIHHLIGAMSQTSTPSSIRHRQVAES